MHLPVLLKLLNIISKHLSVVLRHLKVPVGSQYSALLGNQMLRFLNLASLLSLIRPSGPPPAVSPGPAGPEPGSAVDPGLPAVVQGHSLASKSAGAQPPQPSDAVFHPPRASTPLGSRPSSTSS
ncbi:unnamed protein product, partial [Ixodes persulcatus]